MDELLKLLKEAIGIRPLLPLIVILLAGYFFTLARDYPPKELLYDRWYLLTVLLVVTVSIGAWIFQSGLADRTPEGRYGVYVARLKGDPDRAVHTSLVEAIVANLAATSSRSGLRVEVRDLKHTMEDKDLDAIQNTAGRLNASAFVWGTVIDKETVYLRLWSLTSGVSRSPNPAAITDVSRLAELSNEIWQAIEREAEGAQVKKWGLKREREEILSLRREISQLREIVTNSVAAPSISTLPPPSELKAVLIGVGEYPGVGADLRGPPNDVAALRSALLARDPTWDVRVLLNENATSNAIRDLIQKTASEIRETGLLLVYFSGHGTVTKDGTAFFLPFDFSFKDEFVSGIELKELVKTTMSAHAQTVFITDTPFNPENVPSTLLKQGGILSAGTRPEQVFEAQWRGKPFGSFTAAILETMESTPVDLPVTLDALYGSASLIVKRQYREASPRLAAGPEVPRL